MLDKITFITGNPGKAEQIQKYLHVPLVHNNLDLIEIQSLDLQEILVHKTSEAYNQIKKPVIVDDVSLTIHAMGKLPGPFIKFFIQELGKDRICKLMQTYKNKSAIATVGIGYHDGNGVRIFTGQVQGTIANAPKGEKGFGWDQIFIPDGYTLTRGEMNESDYDLTSPRRMALEKLAEVINN